MSTLNRMSYEVLFPFSLIWFGAILVLIVASRPDSIPDEIRRVLTSWLGLIGLFSVGLVIFKDEPILGTAVFILMFALLAEQHKKTKKEYFLCNTQTDVVTSKKRWLDEEQLDENPQATTDKTVTTYPVQ